MKKCLLALIVFCLFTVQYGFSQCLGIYVIRHAEKSENDSKDPDLSAKGLVRAENWSKFFEMISFDAIYVSPRKRTNQTATPISKNQNLEIIEYEIGKELEILQLEFENQSNKILLVGHSNSIPKFVGRLMNKELEHIEETNFGQFWKVQYCPKNPEMNSYEIFQLP